MRKGKVLKTMSKADHLAAFKYYLAQFNGAKTDESRNAWALLIANELPSLIDSIAEIEPMLAMYASDEQINRVGD